MLRLEYVSRDGTRIKSKTQLRIYLFDLGITGDTAEELVQKADFSQKFARKFILLNSSSDQANDGDTSRDELIAMAMQASFDQQVHLCLYTGGNDSKAPRRILRCSTCS